jgi:hypothetical protein
MIRRNDCYVKEVRSNISNENHQIFYSQYLVVSIIFKSSPVLETPFRSQRLLKWRFLFVKDSLHLIPIFVASIHNKYDLRPMINIGTPHFGDKDFIDMQDWTFYSLPIQKHCLIKYGF